MTEFVDKKNNNYRWGMVGKTVRGASHDKLNLKNQDSIGWYPNSTEDQPLPIIMAISDGHGSPKYFRSDVGSGLAVASAIKVLRTFYRENEEIEDLPALKAKIESDLGSRVVQTWIESVEDHLSGNAFTEEEWARLIQEEGEPSKAMVEKSPKIAYGATLVTVMITPSYILYMRLGDGDILCVGIDERPYRAIPDFKGEAANETESLINSDAAKRFKFHIEEIDVVESPLLILSSTDGYENSYPDVNDFLNIGPEYHKMIKAWGEDWQPMIDEKLEAILNYVSKHGSGDDIALGIIKRADPENIDEIRSIAAMKEDQAKIKALNNQLSERDGETEVCCTEEDKCLKDQQKAI